MPISMEKQPDQASEHVDAVIPHSPVQEEVDIEWTEAEESAVRLKMDLRVVPLVTLLYLLCFLDRSNIGNARIEGLALDLKLHGVRFNWAVSAFYITYILVEIPSNAILKRYGPRYYLPILVLGFGLISLCTAFVKSFAGLVVVRAILGIFEGGVMPGITFYLSCLYKPQELMLRVSFFLAAVGFAGAFGGLLATGLSRIPAWGVASMQIHTWRNIFFFEGLITMLVALVAPLGMPASAGEAWFLSPRERKIAHQRLVQDRLENINRPAGLKDVKLALTSVTNYACGFAFLCIALTVQGLAVFMPTILADLGWTSTRAQLMTVPPNFVAGLVAIAAGYFSDRIQKRGLLLLILISIALVGMACLRWETAGNIRYMGVFFAFVGSGPCAPALVSWALNNSASFSVRAITSAWVVSLGNLGALISTWTFLQKDAPMYPIGSTVNFVALIVGLCLVSFNIAYCIIENKARAAGKRDHRLENLTSQEEEDLDYKHPSFRFTQ